MADKYLIRVTAGSSYDITTQAEVPVNSPDTVTISNDLMDAEVNVRVHKYRGLPLSSPSTSPYFTAEPHQTNGDTYSIAIRFTPKRPPPPPTTDADCSTYDTDAAPEEAPFDLGISAADLQWGNDLDHPIRDRLPPGFGTALTILRWFVDPGLDGDAYADRPHLYGPALSSFNVVHVGPGTHDPSRGGLWFDEGGDERGMETRKAVGAPEDRRGRMKWALRADAKEAWVWEYGRTYGLDFYNGYLDFDEFALRLPGYNLPVMKYWDGQSLRSKPKRSHTLRYVLRNRSTGDVYLVIVFSLYLKEDVGEDGTVNPKALRHSNEGAGRHHSADDAAKEDDEHEEFDEEKALAEARRSLAGAGSEGEGGGVVETSVDDVD